MTLSEIEGLLKRLTDDGPAGRRPEACSPSSSGDNGDHGQVLPRLQGGVHGNGGPPPKEQVGVRVPVQDGQELETRCSLGQVDGVILPLREGPDTKAHGNRLKTWLAIKRHLPG